MLHLDGKTVICALGQRANRADVLYKNNSITSPSVLQCIVCPSFPIFWPVNNMPVRKRYIVWQPGLHKSCLILLAPHYIVTLTGKCIRRLCRWHKDMNGMIRSKAFDNLNRRVHIAVCRNDNGNIASFRKHIDEHTRSESYIGLFLLVGLVLEATVLSLELLFLISSKM